MWVDTRSVHSDNPGWRDMVSSCFHEWLGTFMIAVRRPGLAMHLQKPYPQKGEEGGKRKGRRSFAVYPLSCSTPPLCERLGARFPPLSRKQLDEKLALCIF